MNKNLYVAGLLLARCEKVHKVWGIEYILANEPEYCGKILALQTGRMSSLHYHRKKKETFIVLKGTCWIQVGTVNKMLTEGSAPVVLKPLTQHKFWSPKGRKNNACFILELSSHHDDKDVVRLEESRVIAGQYSTSTKKA